MYEILKNKESRFFFLNNHTLGAGEMTQKLRALAALAEDLDLISRVHTAVHNRL